jgi:hypothetical protein
MEDKIDSFSVTTEETYGSKAAQEGRVIHNESLNNVGESESSALLGLFFYSILMFTVPIGGFWFVKQYLEQNFHLGYTYNLLIPIIVSVVLVNLIIMMYVFRAFREDAKECAVNSRPIEERKKLE